MFKFSSLRILTLLHVNDSIGLEWIDATLEKMKRQLVQMRLIWSSVELRSKGKVDFAKKRSAYF